MYGLNKYINSDNKRHILHEEGPGHGIRRDVSVMEECVEEWQKGVAEVQHTPHGCLGLLPKYKRLLGLWDGGRHQHTDNQSTQNVLAS